MSTPEQKINELEEKLAIAEAASRPVFSRRLLEARLAASEARAENEERQRSEAVTRICGAFGIVSSYQLAAIAERDDETTLDLIVKLIDRAHEAKLAAEARVRALEEALYAVQWCQTDGYELTCPECDQTQKHRHAPDCRIGMLLAPPPEAEKKGGE